LSESFREKFEFISVCTPYDEKAVNLLEEFNFDAVKIAATSFMDWPLLERIVTTNFPIIASTAEATLDEIDNVVSFYKHRTKNFCLMHGVIDSSKNRELNQIDLFKTRYIDIGIGYSDQDSFKNIDSIKIAVAKGAKIFEKQIELECDNFALDKKRIHKLLQSIKDTLILCGVINERANISRKVNGSFVTARGLYALKDIKKGEKLQLANTYFSFLNHKDQLFAREMSKYREFVAKYDIGVNMPIMSKDVTSRYLREPVELIVKATKKLLDDCQIYLPHYVDMEISSHYGLDKFQEWGAVLIKVVNREYCKMLLVLFPNQNYPNHCHKQKEESLHILHGDVTINIEGKDKELNAGDLITIERGVYHSFKTKGGVIIEEVSTTYFKGDSYYEDDSIYSNPNRKVELSYWLQDKY